MLSSKNIKSFKFILKLLSRIRVILVLKTEEDLGTCDKQQSERERSQENRHAGSYFLASQIMMNSLTNDM